MRTHLVLVVVLIFEAANDLGQFSYPCVEHVLIHERSEFRCISKLLLRQARARLRDAQQCRGVFLNLRAQG